MKGFINFTGKGRNEKLELVWLTVKLWAMMMAIFIYLLYADFSTAPEFIYNQF